MVRVVSFFTNLAVEEVSHVFRMGHFKKFEHKKVGHFRKLALINFKTQKEPKMKFFDFGAFQKIKKMVSREKIIFHKLFGASHGTPRSKFRKV